MSTSTQTDVMENIRGIAAALAALDNALGTQGPDDLRADLLDLRKQAVALATFITQMEADEIPVKIAVVGGFSAGKSSFISHLLGQADLCPVGWNPTTSLVTTFTFGPQEQILQHHGNGETDTISRAQYAQRVQGEGGQGGKGFLTRFTFRLPESLLQGLQVIDTPGFDNPSNPADSAVTAGIMKEADAFLYLVDVEGGDVGGTGRKHLEAIRGEASAWAPVYLVLSKADQWEGADLEQLKKELRGKHGDLFQDRILAYSVQEDRPDLDSRQDLTALFDEFRRDKVFCTNITLARRLRRFRNSDLLVGPRLLSGLSGLVSQLDEAIRAKKRQWENVSRSAFAALDGMGAPFDVELWRSFLAHLRAMEIPDAGMFSNSGRILFDPGSLRRDLMTFRTFDVIEGIFLEMIQSLFRESRGGLYDRTVQWAATARKDTADKVVNSIRAHLPKELDATFWTPRKAKIALSAFLNANYHLFRKAAWDRWVAFAHLVSTELEQEFLVDPGQSLGSQRAALSEAIERWKGLRDQTETFNL